jgi:hypothetical protein
MHFVLDQNFPIQVTALPWPPSVVLSRLSDIDPTLTRDYDDWEVIRTLGRQAGIDAFITNDSHMLRLPAEMVALQDSGLILVVTDGVGHDPVRATGLLMAHLLEITRRPRGRDAIYVLKPIALRPNSPGSEINRIASHRHVSPAQLITEERQRMQQALISRGRQ